MRSIKARFEKEKDLNPFLSDLTNFASAITKQEFTRKMIHENFNRIVDKEDYYHLEPSERKELMSWLESL